MTRSGSPDVGAWLTGGASCVGLAHRAAGLPNQDRWRRFGGRRAPGIVVCDGMGSAANGAIGAAAGCAAVAEALPLWLAHPGADSDHLIRLIHTLWAMKVEPLDPLTCATTCLFATADPRGGLVVGQLGDGIILIQRPDGAAEPHDPGSKEFANETTGLGVARTFSEWTVRQLGPGESEYVIVASDGVSEDLIESEFGRFMAVIRSELLPLPPTERWRRLRHELVHWPTQLHADDRTLAVLWREHGPSGGRDPRGR